MLHCKNYLGYQCVNGDCPNQLYDEFPYTKATCLWLYELPPLVATDLVRPIGSWTHQHSSPNMRSKTFPGIAAAFADQWGLGYCQLSLGV